MLHMRIKNSSPIFVPDAQGGNAQDIASVLNVILIPVDRQGSPLASQAQTTPSTPTKTVFIPNDKDASFSVHHK